MVTLGRCRAHGKGLAARLNESVGALVTVEDYRAGNRIRTASNTRPSDRSPRCRWERMASMARSVITDMLPEGPALERMAALAAGAGPVRAFFGIREHAAARVRTNHSSCRQSVICLATEPLCCSKIKLRRYSLRERDTRKSAAEGHQGNGNWLRTAAADDLACVHDLREVH
jgi:hypothetical protein